MSCLNFETTKTVAAIPVAYAFADTSADSFGTTVGGLPGMVGAAIVPRQAKGFVSTTEQTDNYISIGRTA